VVEPAMNDSVFNGMDLSNIEAYQMIHPQLHSSGQPTVDQLALLRAAGVNTVINIALTDASNSLIKQQQHEDRIILDLGMDYIQLPLLWDQPSASQAFSILKFIHFLETQQQTIWIHCAKNMRVSCLMYLYRIYWLNWPIDQAETMLHQIWQPDETWTGLMHAVAMPVRAAQAID
jgi:protein tyrosine phosphatase (PTP) superfamily phosphohydrolase (DUF442 family)